MRTTRNFLLFVLPAALVLVTVVAWPFVYNIWISLTNLGLYTIRDGASFIGLANYLRILSEPDLWSYLLRTLIWTAVNVFFHVVIGVALALLLNRPFRGRAIYRALLIIPWALPQYIAALSWRGMFNYEFGAFNLLLGELGLLVDRVQGLQ